MIGRKHLTRPERYLIDKGLQYGKTIRTIAKELGRDPSVVSREIQRNSMDGNPYCYQLADSLALERKHRCATKIHSRLQSFIRERLAHDESPEQIAAFMRRKRFKTRVSTAAIYQFIWRDHQRGGKLWQHLRFCGKGKRLRKYRGGARYAQKRKQEQKRSIHERKKIINERLRFGDWEMDLIEGKGRKRFMLVIQERKSRYVRAGWIGRKCPNMVANVAKRLLKGYRVHSITTDNGFEFSDGRQLEAAIQGCTVYFTDAYASWQKGQVEHVNGLLRQYFPKGSDFEGETSKRVEFATSRINLRLRKSLNWKAPIELRSRLEA